ncbi:MAG TPA: TetR/AcrR family transcriptional regulator [Puia sp.]|uniref:TetR/AcrR family transcriptional regulator n=1 Tax=Puia sp. TaxID=2045100 RepID=UPI002B6BC74A|nr:TetR/AcrR family transcriptional regulator [Puia sp.]HVU99245.1 TetR/AcrR family transcriptional regulator [Puia sp.]
MGIQERKEKQKLEIRKLILDASMKLFVEEGFENVTIRRIAELIEYSPTTVYLYFKDKDEIFAALHDIGFQKMAEFNKDLDTIRNPLLRLHKMGENYLQFGMENPEYYSLMFIDTEPMDKLAEEGCEEWRPGDAAINRLKATVIECMEKGYLQQDDPLVVSLSIWSFVHGLMSLSIRCRLEKFIPHKEMLLPTMKASLNWFVNNIEAGNTSAKE